ncbi:MAG: radical SAM protein [Pyrinomonadaceae bacterium]
MRSLDFIERRLYQGINYRLRTFARGRFAGACRPTSIALLITERCNARCLHCDIWKNRGQEASPSFEEWKTVLHDLRTWLGPVQVVITGGEALLKDYTIDLVQYASSIGLFVELLSHGFWKDQEKIEKLALARPSRVTISFDGIGATHSLIRGRDGFFDKTVATIQTLKRVRNECRSPETIRLKTVIMEQNLEDVCEIARFARQEDLEVFYQPIEQNYNTAEDADWFRHSNTWPSDTREAIAAVEDLCQLKAAGLPIVNSFAQLKAMISYFENPAALRIATQSHSAHEKRALCSALTMLQIQADGGVTVCVRMEPVGNIKTQPIREIWEGRPQWWEAGCCLAEVESKE